jgi:hypothetical protein
MSENRPEFDELYRNHLANVYRALNLNPPDELSRPILKSAVEELRVEPTGRIEPRIDGKISSYFEWLGAGICRLDGRSGSMHAQRSPVREVQYGAGSGKLFLRIDFQESRAQSLAGIEIRLTIDGQPGGLLGSFGPGGAFITGTAFQGIECAFQNILEASVPVAGAPPFRFQFSLWRDGLPVDAVPQQGWLEATGGES